MSKKKSGLNFLNRVEVFKTSFIFKIINALIFALKLQPMQNGYFFSKDMNNFVSENKENYDVIIFHLIRSAQYLPDEFRGKAILEMTDLISYNYSQIIKKISSLNPLKYIYLFENFLLKRYEKKVSDFFDKIVFISKKELSLAKEIVDEKKIFIIGSSFEVKKKIFVYKKSNYKILFLGNISYFPNKLACYNFATKTLPELRKKYPNIELNIVGKINMIDKLFLNRFSNVKIHGPIVKIDRIIKDSICGICNLEVATGLQMKIFTYMAYGLPVVVSKKAFPTSVLKKNRDALVYTDQNDLILQISRLTKNKKLSNKISKNSHKFIKNKFKLYKIYKDYINLVK